MEKISQDTNYLRVSFMKKCVSDSNLAELQSEVITNNLGPKKKIIPKMIVIKPKEKKRHSVIDSCRNGYSVKATYMLVLISKWFVILHLPYFVFWIIYHVKKYENESLLMKLKTNKSLDDDESEYSEYIMSNLLIRTFMNLFEVLFQSNYAVHFIIYLLNSKLFKRRFKQILSKFGFLIFPLKRIDTILRSMRSDLVVNSETEKRTIQDKELI